jgi:hypothetical protein
MIHQRKWLACACAAVAFVFVACGRLTAADAYNALQIAQVQVLSGGECSVPGTPTTLHRTGGVLDLDLPDGSTPPYYLPVLVVNNLVSAGGSKADEMNNITLSHFSVELSAPGVNWGTSCPATFDTKSFSDTIPPGGSDGASLDIITAAHSQCLQPQIPASGLLVTAKIWAKGRHGGTGIESAPFVFTVTLCKGCLQTAYTKPALVPYRYPADTPLCEWFDAKDTNPYPGNECFAPGQDATILCCAVTEKIGTVTQEVAVCPGTFTGDKSTSTATSTATSTTTGP